MLARGLLAPLVALALALPPSATRAQAPSELYVVALARVATIAQRPATPLPAAFRGRSLYWRVLRSEKSVSYQLCLGFFGTRGEAEQARRQLAGSFADARVIPVPARERDSLSKTLQRAAVPPAEVPPPHEAPGSAAAPAAPALAAAASPPPAPAGSAEALMEEGRAAIAREDYGAAIRAFARAVALPENALSRDAREFLALAYERRGDTTRARLEYENYLKRYPEGEDSVRVRQRLANLRPAPRSEPLHSPVQTAGGGRSIVFGSLSQFYYRGNSMIDTQQQGVTANTLDRTTLSLTDQSALISNVDLGARFLDDTHDNRIVFRDTNTQNFVRGQHDVNRLNAAYYEYRYKPGDMSARLGRQPGNGGGLLGRFDGALLGYGLVPALRLNLVGGEPVDYGVTIDSKRRFLGTSLEVGPLNQRWSGSVYFIRQTIDGIIDREAAGLEVRHFAPQGSFSSLLDYDRVFRRLNMGTMQGNWLAPWGTALHFLADYRMTPALQVGTATLGEASTSVQTLLDTYDETELRRRALALTAKAALASAGLTHPLNRMWQAGLDLNVSRISHTDGTNNVPGTPGTGYVKTLTGQVIGTGLFATRDVSVIAASRVAALGYDGFAARLASRAPLAESWTLDGSVLWYEQNNDNGSTLRRTSPTVRLSYMWGSSMTLELEIGIENTRTSSATLEENTRRSFFSLGYRWDF
jgi:tetratricopeptide (TPR) repeat protein